MLLVLLLLLPLPLLYAGAAAATNAAAAVAALCVLRCQSGLEEPPNSGLVESQRSSKKAVCSE